VDGWTWKQDHRPRPGMQELADEQRKAENAQRAEMLWADINAIDRPTLLFKGENSKILSMEAAEATVAAMPNARLVVIPRATHNVHSDNPSDFARELDTFLSEVLPK
jgi:pimeloyl-ACP methyl ester carboxylesterase